MPWVYWHSIESEWYRDVVFSEVSLQGNRTLCVPDTAQGLCVTSLSKCHTITGAMGMRANAQQCFRYSFLRYNDKFVGLQSSIVAIVLSLLFYHMGHSMTGSTNMEKPFRRLETCLYVKGSWQFLKFNMKLYSLSNSQFIIKIVASWEFFKLPVGIDIWRKITL